MSHLLFHLSTDSIFYSFMLLLIRISIWNRARVTQWFISIHIYIYIYVCTHIYIYIHMNIDTPKWLIVHANYRILLIRINFIRMDNGNHDYISYVSKNISSNIKILSDINIYIYIYIYIYIIINQIIQIRWILIYFLSYVFGWKLDS